MKKVALPLILFFILPLFADAQVVINEIDWMGTANSANDEWIELHNTSGSAVDLTGWELASVDGTPDIPLTGSIPAEGYFLLERTDDSSVPSVKADQIYTGALSNKGETLHLTNASGTVIDSVMGMDGWKNIGGNTQTFQTAQRTENGSWITADPTPRSKNKTGSSGSVDIIPSSSNGQTTSSTSTSSTVISQTQLSASSLDSGNKPESYLADA